MGGKGSTLRSHVKHMFAKHGNSRGSRNWCGWCFLWPALRKPDAEGSRRRSAALTWPAFEQSSETRSGAPGGKGSESGERPRFRKGKKMGGKESTLGSPVKPPCKSPQYWGRANALNRYIYEACVDVAEGNPADSVV